MVLEHCKLDPRVRCLILTGNGRAFNVGMSLKGPGPVSSAEGTVCVCVCVCLSGNMLLSAVDKRVAFVPQVHLPADAAAAYAERNLAPDKSAVLKRQTLAFWDFPKPVVIAVKATAVSASSRSTAPCASCTRIQLGDVSTQVNGLAVGPGANIALMNHGDYVICSTRARFMYPMAKLKITPELGSSFLLPYQVGLAKAKELFMLGDWFDAEEARRVGLANAVCEPEELMARASAVAERLAKNDPKNMKMMKDLMNAPLRRNLDLVLDMESRYELESSLIKSVL